MTRLRSALAASLALTALTALPARAATVTLDGANTGGDILALRGAIVAGDADRLREAVSASNRGGRRVGAVRLDSPGGLVGEAFDVALTLRKASLPTVVTNGSTCASACFVVFAGGSPRYASRAARIGVHSASEKGDETPGSSKTTLVMARALHELGVPDGILGRMAVTAPDDIAWLGEADLASMGVVLTGRPDQLASLGPRDAPAPDAGDAKPLTIRGGRREGGVTEPTAVAPAPAPGLARYEPGSGPPPRRFSDFAAGLPYDGPPGDGGFGPAGSPFHADARILRAAIRGGPDFAGRYAVARGGCAGACGDLWIVDVPTGGVARPEMGRTAKSALAMDWRPDSALLRAHWVAAGVSDDGTCVVYSAVWDGGAFTDEVEQAYGPAEACGWLGWGR